MPKYIDVPGHGVTEFPDSMTDTQIVAAIQRNAPARAPAMPTPQTDPTDGMTGFQKFAAGAGKAIYDTGRGIGNIVTDIAPGAAKYGFATRADTDAANRLDAPLMNTGAGMAGNVVGNVAVSAPLALVPGVNTIAGGAAAGALLGAAAPVGSNDSRGINAATGGVIGAAVPTALRTARALRAAVVDPFTDTGRTRMAGALLSRSTADPAGVVAKLNAARGATPGFNPTVGQAADDGGVAALERTMRAVDPQGFSGTDQAQRGALIDALRSVAQTPVERSAAVSARENAVKPLYDAAKRAVVQGDPAFDALLERPSMNAARGHAANIAGERGGKFELTRGAPEQTIPSGLLDAQGQPIVTVVPAVPATYSGAQLHDLKMGLDDAIGDTMTGIKGAQRRAALDTKNTYAAWLESQIPEYAAAKNTYAQMSRPINQMDIGGELYNRFVPAIADQGGVPFRSTANAYATALRKGDALAKHVTGMDFPLATIMEPGQMATLNGVAHDAALHARLGDQGRGAGSDTVQKIAMSNLAAEAGVPNWMSSMASVPGGWLKRAGDVLYGSADERVRARLSDILRNPQDAAAAMQAAGATPSQIAAALRQGAQGAALSTVPYAVQP